MEMQKSLGETNASIKDLGKTIDSMKTKIDELLKWKNMIIGGALAAGAIISFFVIFLNKALDYVTIKTPEVKILQVPTVTQPLQATPPNLK